MLDHPQVSRYHAMIERMGVGRYRIHDLKSANGVFVGNKRIERESWLKDDDEIQIGPFRLDLKQGNIRQMEDRGMRLDVLHLQKWVSKEKNLLQDISLAIAPQEFVALVGLSGAGKSTLMNALTGFNPATHGAVFVNDIDLYKNFDLFRNELGYVPQKDIVHAELSVYAALDYVAQLRMPPDTTPDERHKRILEVLEDLDLTERKDLPIHKLSGGQLKRVSIGVELLTKPRLFYLDEPTSGLDPGTEYNMMKLLRHLADQGRTIVLITHATKNVMMCDKVIFVVRGGYVAFYGPPEEALIYFDRFRTDQERREKDMEFDSIYIVLEDDKRGKPTDWADRYQKSPAYQNYVVERLHNRRAAAANVGPDTIARRVSSGAPTRVNALRQLAILSSRNLNILMRDRLSLALMLLLAPGIGLMDFMWGRDLFDPVKGDPGKIITDLAISLAVGGDCLSDLAVIRAEPGLFGPVASDATVSRLITVLGADPDTVVKAIAMARKTTRLRAWGLAGDNAPTAGINPAHPLIIDLDATLVTAHSDKEHAAPTFKKGYGFHTLCAFADHGSSGTGEPLVIMLRPGNAGSNLSLIHISEPTRPY